MQLVIFPVNAQPFALPLEAVQRISPAAEATPLPGAPDTGHGAVDIEGEVLPVLRRRFRVPGPEIAPNQQFPVARSRSRCAVLVIDEALGVVDCEANHVTTVSTALPALGVVRLADRLVVIHDLEKCPSLEGSCALDEALERRQ